MKRLTLSVATLWPLLAAAHPGHGSHAGLPGGEAHLLLAVLPLLLAVGLWTLVRRRRRRAR